MNRKNQVVNLLQPYVYENNNIGDFWCCFILESQDRNGYHPVMSSWITNHLVYFRCDAEGIFGMEQRSKYLPEIGIVFPHQFYLHNEYVDFLRVKHSEPFRRADNSLRYALPEFDSLSTDDWTYYLGLLTDIVEWKKSQQRNCDLIGGIDESAYSHRSTTAIRQSES